MFTKIANYGGNTYFEYDFCGMPFQYVEVRHIPKDINIARWDLTLGDDREYRKIAKHWAECVELEHYFNKRDVLNLRRRGIVPDGYSFHHVHPRALGGNTLELKNLVLMPHNLHIKLHDFMRDFIIVKCVPLTNLTREVPQQKKIFMSLPKLPPVVSEIDIPFAMKPCDFCTDVQNARRKIYDYLTRYPMALHRPLFVNGVVARGACNYPIDMWPPPRVHATSPCQIHKTSRQAVRCEVKRWSFVEWSAHIRNRSKNAKF